MALTDKAVRAAQPRDKQYKMADRDGMFLLVYPTGTKAWKLKYRVNGKEQRLHLGNYPETSLLDARNAATDARKDISNGITPSLTRIKIASGDIEDPTFEGVAREWHEVWKANNTERHAATVLRMLERDVFPEIGATPIAELKSKRLLEVAKKVEERGALEMSRKTLRYISLTFQYAIITDRADTDPTYGLSKALKKHTPKHHARLSERDLPEFFRKMEAYDGRTLTKLAMEFLMLTMVRTGELRGARWEEFDIEGKKEWRIPPERMKVPREHIVPLSTQAIAVLQQIREISGKLELVFPGDHNNRKPMSENAILFALYRMGYHGRATGHGFRGTASTILNEHAFNRDWIERQLAHVPGDDVRAAYNAAEYLEGRRQMMQWWADHVDGMRKC